MMKHLPTFWCKLLFSTILFWGTAICRAQTFTNIRATQIIEDNIDNPDLSVHILYRQGGNIQAH